MGTVDLALASDLRDRLGLGRAVETGTYRGVTAGALAQVFSEVVTIELSVALHEHATLALRHLPQVSPLCGDSVGVLGTLVDPETATLYYLDGHWSAGQTQKGDQECPVLDEIAAVNGGHPNDCIIIDDARLFTSAPPSPMDPEQWPMLTEVFDALRARWPHHIVTVLDDQIIAVPPHGKPAVDAYGARLFDSYRERYQRAIVGVRGLMLTTLGTIRERTGRRH